MEAGGGGWGWRLGVEAGDGGWGWRLGVEDCLGWGVEPEDCQGIGVGGLVRAKVQIDLKKNFLGIEIPIFYICNSYDLKE